MFRLNPLTKAIREALPFMVFPGLREAQDAMNVARATHKHQYIVEWHKDDQGFARMVGTAICECGARYALTEEDKAAVEEANRQADEARAAGELQ